MRRGYLRFFLRLFVSLFWVVAALFGVELGARLYDLWGRSGNAFIVAEREKKAFPGRVERLKETRPLQLESSPPVPAWPVNLAPQPDRYLPEESGETIRARRMAFGQLDEEARQLQAFLHSELVLWMTGNAAEGLTPARLYGAYNADSAMRETMQSIPPDPAHPAIRVLAAGSAMERGPAPLPAALGDLEAAYVASGGGVFAFMALRDPAFLRLLLVPYEAPADSPWEIPFVRYKPYQIGTTTLGAGFTTNNLGFRDDDTVIPKPQGRFRILCLGASTTEEGPTNDATYPNMLERNLRTRFPGRDIEVINGGASGMNLFSHFLRLPDYLTLAPDLVVLYLGVNDVARKYLPEFTPAHFAPWAWSEALRRLTPGLLYPNDFEAALGAEVLAHYEALCQAFIGNGIPVAICSFACPNPAVVDSEEAVYYDYCARAWPPPMYSFALHVRVMSAFNADLSRLAARLDMPFIPVAELMQGGSEYFGDICHMRDEGIVRKAAIVETYLAPMMADHFSTP